VALIGAVSLATVFVRPEDMARWFGWPTVVFSAIVPALMLAAAWALWRGLSDGRDGQPFLATLALFVLSHAGLEIGFFPHIVPPALTIHEAAAPYASLLFLLVGTLVLIPMILAHTGYAYRVFRGKVRAEDGYH
jgi:cytochrome d ubiquinol oxidase subunit II